MRPTVVQYPGERTDALVRGARWARVRASTTPAVTLAIAGFVGVAGLVGLVGLAGCADGADDGAGVPTSTQPGSVQPTASTAPASSGSPGGGSGPDAGGDTSLVVPTEPTGVPGLDDDDQYCAAWAAYAGTLQAISVAQAFGDLTDVEVAQLELVAAPQLLAAVNGIASHWPTELMAENPVALSDLIGPYDRRARKALQFLTDAGATDADLDELARLWDEALRRRDPSDPVIRVSGLTNELEALVNAAAVAFDAALTPFSSDPSLDVSAVSTPLTDQYLADHCPDLASIGVGDSV